MVCTRCLAPAPHIRRLNPENWENGIPPVDGQVVSFPPSFTNFGKEMCAPEDHSCTYGGNAIIRPATTGGRATVTLKRLEVPRNGVIRLAKGSRLQFTRDNTVTSDTPRALWKQRTNHELDFRCGLNWGVNGTGLNPSFLVPCYRDFVSFEDVCL
jgi:hypothetical protein